jgi:hypothetical protein
MTVTEGDSLLSAGWPCLSLLHLQAFFKGGMSNILRSTGGALVLVLCEWPGFCCCRIVSLNCMQVRQALYPECYFGATSAG